MSEQGFHLESDTPLTKSDRYDFYPSGLACLLACLLEQNRRRSSTKVVLPENETPAGRRRRAVPVLNLHYQRTKIQPAAGGPFQY